MGPMKPAKQKILIVHINEMKRYSGYPGDIDPREKAYRSSVSDGINLTLFDPALALCRTATQCRVTRVSVDIVTGA
jgi:hypothetical protein